MMLAGRSETNENQNQVLFWKRDFIITESENMASTAAVALSVPHSRSSPVVSLHCLLNSLRLATIMAYRSHRTLSMCTRAELSS